jgi:hypothetical protein
MMCSAFILEMRQHDDDCFLYHTDPRTLASHSYFIAQARPSSEKLSFFCRLKVTPSREVDWL